LILKDVRAFLILPVQSRQNSRQTLSLKQKRKFVAAFQWLDKYQKCREPRLIGAQPSQHSRRRSKNCSPKSRNAKKISGRVARDEISWQGVSRKKVGGRPQASKMAVVAIIADTAFS